MPALPSSLISSLSTAPPGASAVESAAGLLVALGALLDPRARRGVRPALVAGAVCAVVGDNRSYAAIGEWLADLPANTTAVLGIDMDRGPSGAMVAGCCRPWT